MLVAGLSIAMTLVLGGPAQAQAARQKDKNNMRNLAIGLGALAAQQGATGKTANALILGAGAAYAGKKYEDARKAQGREESWRDRYEDDRRYDGDYRRDDDRYNDGLRERQRVRYDRQDNGKKLGHYKNGKLQKGENCR
jgi:hypothetical protein